jgi:hypothetical protein
VKCNCNGTKVSLAVLLVCLQWVSICFL